MFLTFLSSIDQALITLLTYCQYKYNLNSLIQLQVYRHRKIGIGLKYTERLVRGAIFTFDGYFYLGANCLLQ